MSQKTVNVQLISPGTVVFTLFLLAKILGYVTWSWWIVTCPLWLPIVLAVTLAMGALIIGLILTIIATLVK